MARVRRKRKLLRQYVFVLVAVALLVSASFLTTSTILSDTARDEARQSADVIFQQAEDRVTIFEEDISSLYMNVVQNVSVVEFMQAETLPGRWDNLDGFFWVVGNNMRINKSLQNILLYNADDELIASKGGVFFPREEGILRSGLSNFSNCMFDPKTGEAYFQVGMPVYIDLDTGRTTPIGAVYLLFDSTNLQAIVDGALANEDSAVGILDGENTLFVSSGKWDASYAEETEIRESEKELVYVSPVGDTGWRIVSVVPKESLFSGVSQMQWLNQVTYLVVLCALCLICSMVYWTIIKPISRQTAFMASFTQDTRQRIEVTQDNEIGEMAGKMNEMLDDIEKLNREKLESQKKLLELEIEKKQTELIAYRSQINPHFLSNTFNCIRGMALYHGEKEIAELSVALSRFFRYSIRKEEMVTVREAFESLAQYARIVHFRFNDRYRVVMDAPEDVLDERIPKMLLQPLVENAVFHGLETQLGDGVARVTVRRGGGFLIAAVADTGGGMDEKTERALRAAMDAYDRSEKLSQDVPGIGFLNVYRRVRLFFGKQAGFTLDNRPGIGLKIEMRLPLSGRALPDGKEAP